MKSDRSSGLTRSLRQRLRWLRPTRSLVGRVQNRVARAERQQEALRTRIERHATALQKQLATLERQGRQLERLQTKLAKLEQRYLPIEREAAVRMVEHTRMTTHVARLEERIGELEQQLGTHIAPADDAALAEARGIVDIVRREHEQLRVRMQIVSHYEERLRRVEATLLTLADGDPRRMV